MEEAGKGGSAGTEEEGQQMGSRAFDGQTIRNPARKRTVEIASPREGRKRR